MRLVSVEITGLSDKEIAAVTHQLSTRIAEGAKSEDATSEINIEVSEQLVVKYIAGCTHVVDSANLPDRRVEICLHFQVKHGADVTANWYHTPATEVTEHLSKIVSRELNDIEVESSFGWLFGFRS